MTTEYTFEQIEDIVMTALEQVIQSEYPWEVYQANSTEFVCQVLDLIKVRDTLDNITSKLQ